MREETADWLAPLMDAADAAGVDITALIREASIPAEEIDDPSPLMAYRLSLDLPAATARALDWIRFGRLLRDRLGWSDYPERPAPSGGSF